MRKYLILCMGMIGISILMCKKVSFTEPSWEKGEWCEYKVNSSTMGEYTLRYVVLQKEKNMYWFEMVGVKDTSRFIYKMLVPYGFRGKAKRMIIKVNQQQAVELINDPEGEPPGENRPFLVKKEIVDKAKKKRVRVRTPAGEFECWYVSTTDPKGSRVELWLSNEVPVFRIVKFRTLYEKGELIGWGTGAVSLINEKPKIIDLSKFE